MHVLELSPLAEDGLVPAAVAFGLGVANVADDPSAGVVTQSARKAASAAAGLLREGIEGVAILVESILAAAPGVHILVTSREPSRALNERVIRRRLSSHRQSQRD